MSLPVAFTVAVTISLAACARKSDGSSEPTNSDNNTADSPDPAGTTTESSPTVSNLKAVPISGSLALAITEGSDKAGLSLTPGLEIAAVESDGRIRSLSKELKAAGLSSAEPANITGVGTRGVLVRGQFQTSTGTTGDSLLIDKSGNLKLLSGLGSGKIALVGGTDLYFLSPVTQSVNKYNLESGETTNLTDPNLVVSEFVSFDDGSLFFAGNVKTSGARFQRRLLPTGGFEELPLMPSKAFGNLGLGLLNGNPYSVTIVANQTRFASFPCSVDALTIVPKGGWVVSPCGALTAAFRPENVTIPTAPSQVGGWSPVDFQGLVYDGTSLLTLDTTGTTPKLKTKAALRLAAPEPWGFIVSGGMSGFVDELAVFANSASNLAFIDRVTFSETRRYAVQNTSGQNHPLSGLYQTSDKKVFDVGNGIRDLVFDDSTHTAIAGTNVNLNFPGLLGVLGVHDTRIFLLHTGAVPWSAGISQFDSSTDTITPLYDLGIMVSPSALVPGLAGPIIYTSSGSGGVNKVEFSDWSLSNPTSTALTIPFSGPVSLLFGANGSVNLLPLNSKSICRVNSAQSSCDLLNQISNSSSLTDAFYFDGPSISNFEVVKPWSEGVFIAEKSGTTYRSSFVDFSSRSKTILTALNGVQVYAASQIGNDLFVSGNIIANNNLINIVIDKNGSVLSQEKNTPIKIVDVQSF